MKKDAITTIRINEEVKKLLEEHGFSAQKIIDLFIGQNIKIVKNFELTWNDGGHNEVNTNTNDSNKLRDNTRISKKER